MSLVLRLAETNTANANQHHIYIREALLDTN